MNNPVLNSILEEIKKLSFDEQLLLSKHLEHLTQHQDQSVIFRSRLAAIQSHKPEILNIASQYGISNIKIFSLTEDEGGRKNNEFDFLVDLQSEKTLLDLSGFMMDLRDLLSFQVFVFTKDSLKEVYRDKILQKAIKL
ncbi:hypothetical protein C7H19_10145 [Aphanothece hegewaldii CCALA 016]|uniref:Nucleotidyltransferase n=1 Tax=Aphanothece hegewaldii CCALA 016 TaxID=2107694 RepID=A0A2T1LYP4_9CHRO|nr:hypothetical protein [Aphanothece hegewaldii]PSF37518.1 hypothetical protein C7H19_10145 [Aphanothece hegewaldii CCALA 016]